MSELLNLNIYEDRFRNLFNEAPFAVALLSGSDFVVEMANGATLKLWGKDKTIIGKPLLAGVPELKGQELYYNLKHALETGEVFEGKERIAYLDIDGELRKIYVNFTYKPIRDDQDAVTGVLAVGYDVTSHVLTRKKLQAAQAHTQLAIESAGLGTFEYEYKTKTISASIKFTNIFGFEKPASETEYFSRVHPADRGIRNYALARALRTGRLFYEMRLVLPGKTVRWIRINGKTIFDEAGLPIRLLGTALDITEEKESLARLQQSEERFRTLITETPEVGVGLYHGSELRIQYVNDVMLRFWAKDASVIGRTFREAVPELEGQPFFEQLQNVFESGQTYSGREEKAWLNVGGKLRAAYFNYTYKALRNPNGEIYGIHHMAVDVSDLVKARKKVEKNELRLQNLADSMPQLVWIADADGVITYFNSRINEFKGAVKTKEGWAWENMVHPEDLEVTKNAWAESVHNQTTFQVEFRMLMADGTYRWHLLRAYPYDSDEGTKWYGTATDVHYQKVMEMNLENLVKERTLELERSNDDLQQFAHVASHDLKEPVRKIKTFSHKLQDELKDVLGDRGNTLVAKIINSSNRMYSMIDGVLNYASIPGRLGHHEEIDLNRVVENIKVDLELLIQDKQASIRHEQLPRITGVPDLIHQLFYNLINNSLKFSQPDVPSEIVIEAQEVSAGDAAFFEISISDNGIGFDEAYAEQIFTTFVRLNSKDKYEGSGLGLALCKKIVERHGGAISASGEKGKGAKFKILLPK
jgi:PAS domain S-box-containing protein